MACSQQASLCCSVTYGTKSYNCLRSKLASFMLWTDSYFQPDLAQLCCRWHCRRLPQCVRTAVGGRLRWFCFITWVLHSLTRRRFAECALCAELRARCRGYRNVQQSPSCCPNSIWSFFEQCLHMVSLYYRKVCKSLLSLEGMMQWKTPIYYNYTVRRFCSHYLVIRKIIFYIIDLPLSHSEDIFF